jgi:hypothetical protein
VGKVESLKNRSTKVAKSFFLTFALDASKNKTIGKKVVKQSKQKNAK